VDYAILLALIAAMLTFTVVAVGTKLPSTFQQVTDGIDGGVGGEGGGAPAPPGNGDDPCIPPSQGKGGPPPGKGPCSGGDE
jgi:hypothetical protein